MFGYIVVNDKELKLKDFEKYRAYYCGTCRDLHDEYKYFSQITLSYDLTFLGIFLTSLYEPHSLQKLIRCEVHPLSVRKIIRNEYTGYAAAMNVLLSYYKALDDAEDDRSKKAAIYARLLKKSYSKAENKYNEKANICKRNLEQIHYHEKNSEKDIDVCAGLFGEIMAELFVYKKDVWEERLRKFGFYLGKFIYIMDAFDDIEDDIKKGSYNPLKKMYMDDGENFEINCEIMLKMMISEAAKAFEGLPLIEDSDILRNVIYSGVWTGFYKKIRKRDDENM